MDDLKPTDTKVVPLRRGDGADDDERRRLASTIFAEPDEISTFSQGNLVPPRPKESDQAPLDVADPFFARHLQRPSDAYQAGELAEPAAEADEYFARLAEQGAAEMADQLREREQLAGSVMPGSARLSPTGGRSAHSPRRLRPGAPPARGSGRRVAMFSVSITALAAATLAIILITGDRPSPTPVASAPAPLYSALAFDRNPLSLLGNHSAAAGFVSAASPRQGEDRTTTRSQRHSTGRTAPRRPDRPARHHQAGRPAAPRHTPVRVVTVEVTTPVPAPTYAQSARTPSSYSQSPRSTESGAAVSTSRSDASSDAGSGGSPPEPAGPTAVGSASGCNPKCS